MNEILRFLLTHCSFLYETNRFKFVDSEVAPGFGGDAFLVLASEVLRLRFVRDRGQLLLGFQSIHERSEMDWYSVELIQQLLTGDKPRSAVLSDAYAMFLRSHLTEIEERFSKESLADTLRNLRKLERLRAKELFG